ncbi:peptidase M23 family protein [Gordonia effusa NBRC 100432]|uniref:Peptidase M23 family protein n=1 Tax=Gordonia effusa NBRC 100432 TaxID=1077974 RepID=H0QYZ6_9ACTN|nr:peptidase M23 family protein [Gordonia effusa NBRC 100432]
MADAAPRGYGWPLSPRPRVVTPYDPPDQRWQSGHRGVDLAASAGSSVLAAGSGTVSFAGDVGGKPVVSIRHADGLLTTYEPVDAIVSKGQTVTRGQVIGTVTSGHAGCPTTTCLHWGARRGSGSSAVYLNPLALVDAVRVRLKPVGTVAN